MTARTTLKDTMNRFGTGLHRALYKVSGGRIIGRAFGMPVVVLTTTGRKSGQRRETMLTSPVHDDTQVVLVASNGGDHRQPAWYLNLSANPEVELTLHGTTRTMTAHTADEQEKAELWPRIVAAYKGYAGYQTKTDRDIPVVVLEA